MSHTLDFIYVYFNGIKKPDLMKSRAELFVLKLYPHNMTWMSSIYLSSHNLKGWVLAVLTSKSSWAGGLVSTFTLLRERICIFSMLL